ncbi:MAG: hypothetical protein JWO06_1705 [Bacteroidota bacterium]|nr:hypothetical protein [Bacteroidota bacterium]
MSKDFFEQNKNWWSRLPEGSGRRRVETLMKYPDWWLKFKYKRFKKFWEHERGWEYEKYSVMFKDRDVLEIGGGLGNDGMTYAKTARSYTYAEIKNVQLEFLKRITALFNVHNAKFELMDSITHQFPNSYNAFLAHGVLHHVPFEVAKVEFDNIDKYLLPGSKAVFLMYPKQRWEASNKPSFEEFGKFTDGGCPWAEYYDETKMKDLVGPGYVLDNTKLWGEGNIEFVNFEFTKRA